LSPLEVVFLDPVVVNTVDKPFLQSPDPDGTRGERITASSRLNIKHTAKPHRFTGSVKSDLARCTKAESTAKPFDR
jgi:hypothetical protein